MTQKIQGEESRSESEEGEFSPHLTRLRTPLRKKETHSSPGLEVRRFQVKQSNNRVRVQANKVQRAGILTWPGGFKMFEALWFPFA